MRINVKLFLILFAISFCGYSKLFFTITRQAHVFYDLTEQTKNKKDSTSNDDNKSIFIDAVTTFNKTAFYAANYFYLGASSPAAATSALSRAVVQSGTTPDLNALGFIQMAPQQVLLNDEQDQDNPIYNHRISNLTLMGQFPVVMLADAVQVGNVTFGANQLVCLVDDISAGKSVKINTAKLKDAAELDSAGVVGIVGSSSNIIAAVMGNTETEFKGNNSGFLLISETAINSEDKKDTKKQLKGADKAVKLDLDAGKLLAITQNAQIDGLGDMYWDATLQRLYIGLVGVGRADHSQTAGAVSILVGRVDDNALVIEPCVQLNSGLFGLDSAQYILGFYYDTDSSITITTQKLRTMHTSTGNTYLIVNGGVGVNGAGVKNQIYAIPVIAQADTGAGATEANIGKIAKKTDFTALPADSGDMTKSVEATAIIGQGVLPINSDQEVQEIFVLGDSVFCCLAQDRSTVTKEAGIFRSTAIFAANGKIRTWTPWQRVMGSIDKVFGGSIDSTQANYWYLTTDGVLGNNTVKVTQWGKSVEVAGLMGNGLVTLLNEEFKQENAGVHQIFNFDEQTPSLAKTTVANKKSIMIATGFEKVALIQSGSTPAGGIFTPTQDEFVKDTNVFVWQGDALENIGPICCAEVSRVNSGDTGWLFVGGYYGLAVLSQVDGSGWDATVAGAAIDFATVHNNSTFKILGDFSQVRKLVAQGDSSFLYVLTDGKLYRFHMEQNKFRDVNPTALNEKELKLPGGTPLDMLIFYYQNGEVKILVATTDGLFASDNINNTDETKTPAWTPVVLNSGQILSDPVAHLYFVSNEKGGVTENGNLYALAADFSLNLASIYRFNVEDGNITPLAEKSQADNFYDIGQLRATFVTDGALGFHQLSTHLDNSAFLNRISMLTNPNTIRSGENILDLNVDQTAYNVGLMIQNSASGAWIVPGDWGIRVND